MRNGGWIAGWAAVAALLTLAAAADEGSGRTEIYGDDQAVYWHLSPMAGEVRNELDVRAGPPGTPEMTVTDREPIYGFFLMMESPRWKVNNFAFQSEVNQSDIWGDLFYVNYYDAARAPVSWNTGAGYLYHQIEPPGESIKVTLPMLKAGPTFYCSALGLFANPYIGYGWERVDTRHGNRDNDSWFYGLTLSAHWRMLMASVNYYYQDSQELEEDFQTWRARLIVGLDREHGLGLMIRFDHEETSSSRNDFWMIGPVISL